MSHNKSHSPNIAAAQKLLAEVHKSPLSLEERKKLSIKLAALIIEEAERIHTPSERKRQAELDRMMKDPMGKAFTTAMTDQCFRTKSKKRIADQMVFLLKKYGIPRFLSLGKRFQLYAFKKLGKSFYSILVPLAIYFLRRQTKEVIIPGEKWALSKHIRKRRREGIRLNLNHLGEAILGEEEARRRLNVYLHDLEQDDIDYVSIKVSTIYSQINLIGYEKTIEHVSLRLRELYRAAMNHRVHKFVNLDMEEYKDLFLTKDVFMKVLSEDEFMPLSGGIVLQAYLPDSYQMLKELTEWAIDRVEKGGAPIKVRIVKGANMCMEQHEASAKGWEQAPYYSKVETDANYKRMVMYALEKKHAKAVNIGIASHNIFDIAFALLLRSENGVEREVSFEMLEGMADHMRRVVHELAGDILLYCAVATKADFQSAIAYLIRRLDENTGIDNFLAHSFGMKKDSPEWMGQVEIFSKSCDMAKDVRALPNRTQNRNEPPKHLPLDAPFTNEADTDFSLPHNRKWVQRIIKEYKEKTFGELPVVIDGEEILNPSKKGFDPSVPSKTLYTYTLADWAQVDKALDVAEKARKEWAVTPLQKRCEIISNAAKKLRENRGELIGIMIADGGKNPVEADVEISEAIDFCEYYIRSLKELHSHTDLAWGAKGTILVTPPWNFPCAIPLGGVVAGLLTGNTVLFKPAGETALVGYELATILWNAGIPKKVLQFIQCEDDPTGSRLIQDARVSTVILTGATSTAELFMKMRPSLHLCAETGGKNSTIISALADRDLAIKELIHSAFGHAGQKCSATSLLILEKEVYDDTEFFRQLRDAAASVKVGPAWDPKSKVTPLIHPPGDTLQRGLTTLDEGEEWVLEPKQDPDNPNLWSPGIKKGVQPGSFSHRNEFFGPVLSVLRAEDLLEGLHIANDVEYGLTSGLQSLDEREQKKWQKTIVAGNLYINRGTTGAIVQRQAFGGTKKSCFGHGSKAGGPNYLSQFMIAQQIEPPQHKEPVNEFVNILTKALDKIELSQDELGLFFASVGNYSYWMNRFKHPEDKSRIIGQDNLFSYTDHKHMYFRITKDARPIDYLRVFAAALTTGTSLNVSWEKMPQGIKWRTLLPTFAIIEESDEEFIESIRSGRMKRIRMVSKPSDRIIKEAAQVSAYVDSEHVLANGRIELLHYMREVSLSVDYHRYGNLGTREKEKRAPLIHPDG